MRKALAILVCIALIPAFAGCGASIINIPSGYIRSTENFSSGIQDHTDFCVYIYESANPVKNDADYSVATEEDVEILKGYFDDFKGWAELKGGPFSYQYFGVSAGDYFIIRTKEGQPVGDGEYGKYDDYSVWFFDIESLTLYYMHNNI